MSANDIIPPTIIHKLEQVNGWLMQPATELTAYLFNVGLGGNVLELGVYHGKYLALLYYLSGSSNSRLLGVDAFIGSPDIELSKSYISHNVRVVCGDSDRLSLICADTMCLTRERVLGLLPEPIVFISVDAGHEAENLTNDLELSATLLAPGGIIAVDDAFNHSTPGAIEGTCRYFEQKNRGRLAPFAHCYNKLFLTTPDHHFYYLQLASRFIQEFQDRSYCAKTLRRKQENDQMGFVPRFFSYEILPFL
jgi:Methyltransferase domain